jgi:hypothetical protein
MKQQVSSTVPIAAEQDVEHVIVLDDECAATVGDDDSETHKGHPHPRMRITLIQRATILVCVLLAVWFAEEIADGLTVARRPIVNWKQRNFGLMGPSPLEYNTTGTAAELAITKAALATARTQLAVAVADIIGGADDSGGAGFIGDSSNDDAGGGGGGFAGFISGGGGGGIVGDSSNDDAGGGGGGFAGFISGGGGDVIGGGANDVVGGVIGDAGFTGNVGELAATAPAIAAQTHLAIAAEAHAVNADAVTTVALIMVEEAIDELGDENIAIKSKYSINQNRVCSFKCFEASPQIFGTIALLFEASS